MYIPISVSVMYVVISDNFGYGFWSSAMDYEYNKFSNGIIRATNLLNFFCSILLSCQVTTFK